jgi:hypothetical protein
LRDLVGSLLRNSCQGFKGVFVGHDWLLSENSIVT